ncbi:MAG: cytochrome oxidase putative small subunit CydP [Gammaproteobacteria bacterium]
MPRIRDRRLTRHITLVLTLKVIALLAMWYFFFSPAHRPAIDAGRVDDRLFPAPAANAPESRHDGT